MYVIINDCQKYYLININACTCVYAVFNYVATVAIGIVLYVCVKHPLEVLCSVKVWMHGLQ